MVMRRNMPGSYPGRPLIKGMLHDPDFNVVLPFQYNPPTIMTRRTTEYQELTAPGVYDAELLWKRGGGMETTFELFFDGREAPWVQGIRAQLDKVAAFMDPDPRIPVDSMQFHSPPVCVLTWGSRSIETFMVASEETIEMFNRRGEPIRGKVSVTLRRRFPSRTVDIERARSVQFAWTGVLGSVFEPPAFVFREVV